MIKIKLLNGSLDYHPEALINDVSVISPKEKVMREGLTKLFEAGLPSFNQGEFSSQDTTLYQKPTGSFGSNNFIGDDEKQAAYKKPVSQLPIGMAQNNSTDGQLHFNGEAWDTNNNNIGDGDVKHLVGMLKQKGVFDKMPNDIEDELRMAFDYEFNQEVKHDKYTTFLMIVDKLSKNPNFYKELGDVIIDQPNQKEKENEPTEENPDPDFDDYIKVSEKDKEENDIDNWWPGHNPVGYEKFDEETNKKIRDTTKECVKLADSQMEKLQRLMEKIKGPVVIRKKSQYTKEMLMEAVKILIDRKEELLFNQSLTNPFPLTTNALKKLREDTKYRIALGQYNDATSQYT